MASRKAVLAVAVATGAGVALWLFVAKRLDPPLGKVAVSKKKKSDSNRVFFAELSSEFCRHCGGSQILAGKINVFSHESPEDFKNVNFDRFYKIGWKKGRLPHRVVILESNS